MLRISMRYGLALAIGLLFTIGTGHAGEKEGKGKGRQDQLAKEQEKHLKRLALFDRLEEIASEHKNEGILKNLPEMREKEESRYQRAVERLTGKKGDEHGKDGEHGKAGEHDKDGEHGKDGGHGEDGEDGEHGKDGRHGKAGERSKPADNEENEEKGAGKGKVGDNGKTKSKEH